MSETFYDQQNKPRYTPKKRVGQA